MVDRRYARRHHLERRCDREVCAEAMRRFLDAGGRRILFVARIPALRALARRVRHETGAPIEFFTSRAAADSRLLALRSL